MFEFNCTVKDLFRRPTMIDNAVRRMADNGYTEHAVIYACIRDNIYNALAYAAFNMKDYEYKAAVTYLEYIHTVSAFALAGKLQQASTEFFNTVTDFGQIRFIGSEHHRRNIALFVFVPLAFATTAPAAPLSSVSGCPESM